MADETGNCTFISSECNFIHIPVHHFKFEMLQNNTIMIKEQRFDVFTINDGLFFF